MIVWIFSGQCQINSVFSRALFCNGELKQRRRPRFENVDLFRLVQFRSNVGNFDLELNSKSYIEVRNRKR